MFINTAGRPRVLLETASVAGGAVGLLFISLVVGFFVYVQKHRQKKQEELQNGHQTNGHQNYGADVTDGTLSCSCQQSQIQFSQLSYNRSLNGDHEELQHPQHQQFSAQSYVQCPLHKPKRPFGPHHDYRPISMEEVILKR